MGSCRIVVPPPSFDEHLGLLQGVEDLSIQQLIPELAVEALVVAVLPRASGFNEERLWPAPLNRIQMFS